jgi:hypothetical protein
MMANQRLSASRRGLLAGSTACGACDARLSLPRTPDGAILPDNHSESEECRFVSVFGWARFCPLLGARMHPQSTPTRYRCLKARI